MEESVETFLDFLETSGAQYAEVAAMDLLENNPHLVKIESPSPAMLMDFILETPAIEPPTAGLEKEVDIKEKRNPSRDLGHEQKDFALEAVIKGDSRPSKIISFLLSCQGGATSDNSTPNAPPSHSSSAISLGHLRGKDKRSYFNYPTYKLFLNRCCFG